MGLRALLYVSCSLDYLTIVFVFHKSMDLTVTLIKVGRNEISDILYRGDTLAEEKVIRSLELKRDAAGLLKLFQVISCGVKLWLLWPRDLSVHAEIICCFHLKLIFKNMFNHKISVALAFLNCGLSFRANAEFVLNLVSPE